MIYTGVCTKSGLHGGPYHIIHHPISSLADISDLAYSPYDWHNHYVNGLLSTTPACPPALLLPIYSHSIVAPSTVLLLIVVIIIITLVVLVNLFVSALVVHTSRIGGGGGVEDCLLIWIFHPYVEFLCTFLAAPQNQDEPLYIFSCQYGRAWHLVCDQPSIWYIQGFVLKVVKTGKCALGA